MRILKFLRAQYSRKTYRLIWYVYPFPLNALVCCAWFMFETGILIYATLDYYVPKWVWVILILAAGVLLGHKLA
jgi:hypothetical protein